MERRICLHCGQAIVRSGHSGSDSKPSQVHLDCLPDFRWREAYRRLRWLGESAPKRNAGLGVLRAHRRIGLDRELDRAMAEART